MEKVPINLKISKGAGILHNQAIVANGMVYCSGQLPADLGTGELVPGDIKQNTERCIENLKVVLEAAGSSLENVVKVNIFLADIKDVPKVNELYVKYWGSIEPVRTCLAVKNLPRGADIEMECTALLSEKSRL
ncbi:endoribonuclease L-PSP [Cadophora sp. DSE1049]|nr:endoribonuclease L-PSP [Cadophora sp. DSE1049]